VGARWRGSDAAFGVTNDGCEVHNYPGLFCMDSSAIPTSLGVNPSLTIAAVCERAAAGLVARAADYGLPAPPAGLRARRPREVIGDRVRA
jgi:choline dehydrogenase-like flavoprotein